MANENNIIMELFPSWWVYNAGVIGFLKILEKYAKEIKVEENKINVKAPENKENLSENITKDLISESEKVYKPFFGSQKSYLVNQLERNIFNAVKTILFEFKLLEKEDELKNKINQEEGNEDKPKGKKTKEPMFCSICGKLTKNYERWLNTSSVILGASKGEFLNSFWNLNREEGIIICDLCYGITIFHLVGFSGSKELGTWYFVNAPTFEAMWYLNKYVQNYMENLTKNNINEIFGIPFIKALSRIYSQLGWWGLYGIQIITLNKKEAEFYFSEISLPIDRYRKLFEKNLVDIFTAIGNENVLKYYLEGDIDLLEKITFLVYKDWLKTREKDNEPEIEVKELSCGGFLFPTRNKIKKEDISKLAKYLPKLLSELNKNERK